LNSSPPPPPHPEPPSEALPQHPSETRPTPSSPAPSENSLAELPRRCSSTAACPARTHRFPSPSAPPAVRETRLSACNHSAAPPPPMAQSPTAARIGGIRLSARHSAVDRRDRYPARQTRSRAPSHTPPAARSPPAACSRIE